MPVGVLGLVLYCRAKPRQSTLARSQSAAAHSNQPAQQLAEPTASADADAEAQHARRVVVWCGVVWYTRYVRQVRWELGRNKGIVGLDVGDGASRDIGGDGEGEDWQRANGGGKQRRGGRWTAPADKR
jgi:hypothetical protein